MTKPTYHATRTHICATVGPVVVCERVSMLGQYTDARKFNRGVWEAVERLNAVMVERGLIPKEYFESRPSGESMSGTQTERGET